jgi:uncharacterized protein YbjT (DUF2867 family)
LRGVDTVVHLAAATRDQPRASIEELNAVATLRLIRAAERAGAERFVFFSAIGATLHSTVRFFRAKALAQQAVEGSALESTVFCPSIVYSPGDPWLTLLERLSWLPLVPISGSGRALYQPIFADDAADCVVAALRERGPSNGPFELAGPESLSYDDMVRMVLRGLRRRRALVHVPLPLVRTALQALRRVIGPGVFATWEEAELLEIPMTTRRGTADAERLGVTPKPMSAVVGG